MFVYETLSLRLTATVGDYYYPTTTTLTQSQNLGCQDYFTLCPVSKSKCKQQNSDSVSEKCEGLPTLQTATVPQNKIPNSDPSLS